MAIKPGEGGGGVADMLGMGDMGNLLDHALTEIRTSAEMLAFCSMTPAFVRSLADPARPGQFKTVWDFKGQKEAWDKKIQPLFFEEEEKDKPDSEQDSPE